MSRIYIGSKISTINSIKNEFPDRVLSLCDNPEIQAKNYSIFFDNNKLTNLTRTYVDFSQLSQQSIPCPP